MSERDHLYFSDFEADEKDGQTVHWGPSPIHGPASFLDALVGQEIMFRGELRTVKSIERTLSQAIVTTSERIGVVFE